METEFVNIFQHFDFPTALSIISLLAFAWLGKRFWERDKEQTAEALKFRDQFIGYLQQREIEQSGAILENATAAKETASAFKETASALNRFSLVLERLEKFLSIHIEQKA